jgi:hypothetical protein
MLKPKPQAIRIDANIKKVIASFGSHSHIRSEPGRISQGGNNRACNSQQIVELINSKQPLKASEDFVSARMK